MNEIQTKVRNYMSFSSPSVMLQSITTSITDRFDFHKIHGDEYNAIQYGSRLSTDDVVFNLE